MDIQKEIDKVKPQAEQLLKEPNKLEKFLKEAEIELEKIPGIGNDLSALVTMIRMIRDYCNGTYKEIPTATIVAIIAALIYVISPVDIIPDELIPVIGFADDVTVIKFAIEMVKTDLNKYKSLKENKMDIKNLLSQMAEFDEMEAPDGMNIAEDIEEENELAENKRKKRIYQKAIQSLEELQNFLWEGVSPATGKLDADAEEFNQLINTAIAEIHSRSLAFDESLNEAKIKNGIFNDKDVMLDKISHVGIVCRPAEYDTEKTISFSFISDPQYSKSFRAPKDSETDPEIVANVCAEILRKHIDPAEDEILASLDKYGYKQI